MLSDQTKVLQFRGLLGVWVEVSSTLIMLALLFVLLSGAGGHTLVVIAMLVGSIYLHELGHAWGNIVQGVPVRRIVLHGGGGFCESAGTATARQQEFVVAMGPIVNLALWALASLGEYYLWERVLSPARSAEEFGRLMQTIWPQVAVYLVLFGKINLALCVFNLLPVQPLDGGKLIKLALQRFMPPAAALKIAGGIGLVFSILWWPALFLVYASTGWLLLFAPSLYLHLAMWRGEIPQAAVTNRSPRQFH